MKRTAVAAALALLAASAAAAPFAHVSNERSGTVTVIDTATNKVVSNLRVGSQPRGIQVSADGRRVFVALTPPTG